ncbi:MAG: alpha/beta fold hydrolase [Verrucomicrobia bacterium]|nr:alpha/beta fold hydrolase [Verrucomicrobiota bacterium]
MTHLLDTSALLAHYLAEPGAERVQALFEDDAVVAGASILSLYEFELRLPRLRARSDRLRGHRDPVSQRILADQCVPFEAVRTVRLRGRELRRLKELKIVMHSFLFLAVVWACIGCRTGQGHRGQRSSETSVGMAVSSDGVPIGCEVAGRGGTALVFIHGWACDRSFWRAQMDYFAPHYRVVAIDLAGHGESGTARRDWTIERFGDDVCAVIEKLGLRRVVLVGHSMGGSVALEAARHTHAQVLGVVGIDAFHDVEMQLSPEQIDQMAAPFRTDFAAALSQYARANFFTTNADPAFVERIVGQMAATAPEAGLGAGRALFQYDARPALRELRIPIYCLISDRMPTNVEAAKRCAYSFDLVLLRGRGHFLMMEDAPTVNRLLAEFVTRSAKSTARRTPAR